jgi:membrane protein DedA with SNARE-associated domain
MEQQVLAWITQYGYIAIFSMLVLGIIGLPIPDETMLTFSGFLIYQGDLSLPLTYITALCGSATGITISYVLGRKYGHMLIRRYGKYLHINEEHLAKAHAWFERAGHWSLTFGYYIPGVRHFTAYAAGMSDLEAPKFCLFAYSGAAIWTASFIGLGYFLGERWHSVEENIHAYFVDATIAIAIAVGVYLVWRKLRRPAKP